MWSVSDDFAQEIVGSNVALAKVEVWRGGEMVEPDLPIVDGAVTVDNARPGVRRQLSLTTPPLTGAWDMLAPDGTELRPFRGVRFVDGQTEMVPLGMFGIDTERLAYTTDGGITLSAPDRYARVQRARFLTPQSTSGRAVSEALRLAAGAFPDPPEVVDLATSQAPSRAAAWERDRDKAVEELAKSAGAEVYFDQLGRLVARDTPTLDNPPVWRIEIGERGVVLTADRERSRQRTYNCVVYVPTAVDGGETFPQVVVQDDDPTSPTYVGGPFGLVPYFYSSPLITTAAQAQAALIPLLDRVRGFASVLTLEAVVNPALDAGDVIDVQLPDGTTERHIIDTVSIPLTVGGTQQIRTRSTRPDDEEQQA